MEIDCTTQAFAEGCANTYLAYNGSTIVWGILTVIGLWFMFRKAGIPGWYAIIPIFNIYITIKMAGKPGWWTVLYFIPIVNLVVFVLVDLALAKSFGKSPVFAIVGLFFFAAIGYLILGFGRSKYTYLGPDAPPATITG